MPKCLNIELSSFGNNKEEALTNLKEAIDLYYEDFTTSTVVSSNPSIL